MEVVPPDSADTFVGVEKEPQRDLSSSIHGQSSHDLLGTRSSSQDVLAGVDKPITDTDASAVAPQVQLGDSGQERYHKFSKAQRNGIVALQMAMSMLVPLTSTLYMPSLTIITVDLNTTAQLTTLSVALYLVGMSLFPMVWARISDHYGRRWVSIASLGIYFIFSVALCFTGSIGQLIGLRVAQACGIASAVGIGSAVIADVVPPASRGQAIGIYYIAILVGPVIGPLLGGALAQAGGWRSIFYFTSAYAGVLIILLFFFQPETLEPRFRLPGLPRPWEPLFLLRDYRVLVASLCIGVGFFAMYLQFTVMALRMGDFYLLPVSIIGVCYLPFGAGLLIGPILGGKTADYCRAREGSTMGRLIPTLIAMPLLPIPLLVFGFTVRVHLAALMVTSFFGGWFLTIWTPGITSFLMELHPTQTASVAAMIPLMQYGFAAISSGTASLASANLGEGYLFLVVSCSLLLFWAALMIMFFHNRRLLAEQRAAAAAAKEAPTSAAVEQEGPTDEKIDVVSVVPDAEAAAAAEQLSVEQEQELTAEGVAVAVIAEP